MRRREIESLIGKTVTAAATASLLILLSGCGGGGSEAPGTGTGGGNGSGLYLDSPVEGVSYRCGSHEGTTDHEGTFLLDAGQECVFTLGGHPLHRIPGTRVFDGMVLMEDNLSIAELLMTLDADGDADNGLKITPQIAASECVDRYFSELNASALAACLRSDENVSDYGGNPVDEEEAAAHLGRTRASYAPVADSMILEMDEDGVEEVDLAVTDPNGDEVNCTLTEAPEHATAVLDGCRLRYVPAPDYNGADRLMYVAEDSTGLLSDPAEVNLTINPVNDAPVLAELEDRTLEEDFGRIPVELNATDVDGDRLSYSVSIADESVVQAEISGRTLTLVSLPGAYGTTRVDVNVSDGHGGSTGRSFVVTVTRAANHPPLAASDRTEAWQGQSTLIDVLANDHDADGDSLRIVQVSNPDHGGRAEINGTKIRYTSPEDFVGTESFLYTVDDGHGGTDTAKVFVSVHNPNNHPPTARDLNLTVPRDQLIDTYVRGHDEDGDRLSYAVTTPPRHGQISINPETGYVIYEPDDTYLGEDSFGFRVSDGEYNSTEATVAITVYAQRHERFGDWKEERISAAEFDRLQALPVPIGQKFYEVNADSGEPGGVRIDYHQFVDDHTVYDSSEDRNYTYGTDGNVVRLDFDGDGSPDLSWKYLGESNATAWFDAHHVSLPASAAAKLYDAVYRVNREEYDIEDEPLCAEQSDEGCESYYRSLADLGRAVTFDPDVPDAYQDLSTMTIGGYDNFMLAQGSDVENEENGTLVRIAHYWDPDTQRAAAKVTLADAGTWEKRRVNGTEYLLIKPAVYDINETRIYVLGEDGKVHAGEYLPPNRAYREHNFDERTAYLLANAVMRREVSTTLPLKDERNQLISFENLPASAFEGLVDQDLYRVGYEPDGDGGGSAKWQRIRFDANGTLLYAEEANRSTEIPYSVQEDIVHVDADHSEGKYVTTITDNGRVAELLSLEGEALGSAPKLYLLATIKDADSLESRNEPFRDLEGNSFDTLDAFMDAFRRKDVVVTRQAEGYSIVYGGENNATHGRLIQTWGDGDSESSVDAGWWERTRDHMGRDMIVFHYYGQPDPSSPNVALVDDACGGKVCQGDLEAKDTGTIEYWVDRNTGESIVDFLRTNERSYSMEELKRFKIYRSVQAQRLSDVDGVELYWANIFNRGEGCDRTIGTGHIVIDSDANILHEYAPDGSKEHPFVTRDSKVMEFKETGNPDFYLKVRKVMNADEVAREFGLLLPPTAHAFRLDSFTGDIGDYENENMERHLFLRKQDLIYLQSYLMNNPNVCRY